MPTRPLLRRRQRPWLAWILGVFAGFVLVDALFGESGYFALLHARTDYTRQWADLQSLRQQNAVLREQQRRLREDPGAVEETARRELGLLRRGEILIMLRDRATADGPAAAHPTGVQ